MAKMMKVWNMKLHEGKKTVEGYVSSFGATQQGSVAMYRTMLPRVLLWHCSVTSQWNGIGSFIIRARKWKEATFERRCGDLVREGGVCIERWQGGANHSKGAQKMYGSHVDERDDPCSMGNLICILASILSKGTWDGESTFLGRGWLVSMDGSHRTTIRPWLGVEATVNTGRLGRAIWLCRWDGIGVATCESLCQGTRGRGGTWSLVENLFMQWLLFLSSWWRARWGRWCVQVGNTRLFATRCKSERPPPPPPRLPNLPLSCLLKWCTQAALIITLFYCRLDEAPQAAHFSRE